MVDRVTIGALPPLATLEDDAIVEVEQGGQSYRTTIGALRASVLPGGPPNLGLIHLDLEALGTALSGLQATFGLTENAQEAADAAEAIRLAVIQARGIVEQLHAQTTVLRNDTVSAVASANFQSAAAMEAIALARARMAYQFGRLQIEVALTRVGVLAEYRERVTAVGVEIERIDGIIATIDDPTTGLSAAHGLIATLESLTLDTENPLSLAAKLAVVEAAIETADTALDARISTLETASVQQADDLADLAGEVTILDEALVEAQQDIADNAGGLVAVAETIEDVAAELDAQGDELETTQAALTTVTQAVALESAAGLYRAQLGAVRTGLSRVAVLAEVRARATESAAIYEAIDVVDLMITEAGTGLGARMLTAEGAILDLDANKAEVSALSALSATVSGQGDAIDDLEEDYTGLDGRVTTAEAGIATHSSAIATLDLDLADLDGALALVAGGLLDLGGDVAGLDDRLGDVEDVAASLVSTVTAMSASLTTQGDAIDDLGQRADDAEDTLGDLDGRQTTSEAEIVGIKAVGVTRDAAVAYDAQRMAVQIGLSQVSVLAEKQIRVSDIALAYDSIDAVELTVGDNSARLTTVEAAVIDLEAGKASVTVVDAIEVRMDDAEASITEYAEVAVSADGIARAVKGVTTDVGGKITGWESANDGENTSFTVKTDKFVLEDDGGVGFAFSNRNFRIYDEEDVLRVRLGLWED